MNLTSPIQLKTLLNKYNLLLNKRLGQHFLIDRNVLNKIIEFADLRKSDVVLEIGAGVGTLTRELAKRVRKVVAVEMDKGLCEISKETTKEFGNIEIVCQDILGVPSEDLIKKIVTSGDNTSVIQDFKVVANLPYQITSPVLKKFLASRHKPKMMLLLVQKEVAEKICASPPDMSRISVLVQFYGQPEVLAQVSKNCFWPKPEITSNILKIKVYSKPPFKIDEKKFFQIVRIGFSSPRKQLINNLSSGLRKNKKYVKIWLEKAGIKSERRAETLNIREWVEVTKRRLK